MKAITVRQPWAWAIIHGGKDVENRTRNIAGAYRGPVAIHAGLRDDESAGPVALLTERWVQWWADLGALTPQRGHILGVVDLVDVHRSELGGCPTGPQGRFVQSCSQWAIHGDYHMVLANPRPLAEPIPWTGRLGLWTLPDDVLSDVAA